MGRVPGLFLPSAAMSVMVVVVCCAPIFNHWADSGPAMPTNGQTLNERRKELLGRWVLEKLIDSNGNTAVPDSSTKYAIEFAAQGVAIVTADCNTGRGRYRFLSPTIVEIDALTMTRVRCPPGSLFDVFTEGLDGARSTELSVQRLTLKSAVAVLQMTKVK
jgi:heat shock protein HslJ